MDKIVKNRYKIIKKIGSGGMADVYLALDLVLNREVALKVLRGTLADDPVALLRFEREALAVSDIVHSNIVEVYDVVGDYRENFIVMEYVKGSTLKELIHKRGALDYKEAVFVMKQIAAGLMAAHDKQIIHRDIKPQNILIKSDGTVKITDFGIALSQDALQLTKSDSVLGSVHYLAPECSRGEGASNQSDIYALGIVFFELLTGKVPYTGENAVEIAMKHMKEPFPDLKEINPLIPNSIVNIINKSTQKNKSNRYLSMHQFIEELDVCLLEENLNETLWELEVCDDEGTIVIDAVRDVKTPEKKRTKKQQIILYSSIGIVAVISIILGILFLTPEKVEMVKIPGNIIGKPIDEVVKLLENSGLSVNPVYTYDYSEEYENDMVLNINPEMGNEVEKGSEVSLTVSKGKTMVVPNFTGWTLEEVEKALVGYNVTIRETKVIDFNVEVGKVIEQKELLPETTINPSKSYYLMLYVSDYPSGVIPTIVGMDINDARKTLEDKHFNYKLEKLSFANMSENEVNGLRLNTVIRVNPPEGSYYVQKEENVITIYYYDKDEKPTFDTKPQEETPEPEEPVDNTTSEEE